MKMCASRDETLEMINYSRQMVDIRECQWWKKYSDKCTEKLKQKYHNAELQVKFLNSKLYLSESIEVLASKYKEKVKTTIS